MSINMIELTFYIYIVIEVVTVFSVYFFIKLYEKLLISSIKCRVFMVNTRQFSGSTYMQDMTKSHRFSAKNRGSTYTPIRLIRREIRYWF